MHGIEPRVKEHLYRMTLRNDRGSFAIRFKRKPNWSQVVDLIDHAMNACIEGAAMTRGPFRGCYVDEISHDVEWKDAA